MNPMGDKGYGRRGGWLTTQRSRRDRKERRCGWRSLARRSADGTVGLPEGSPGKWDQQGAGELRRSVAAALPHSVTRSGIGLLG